MADRKYGQSGPDQFVPRFIVGGGSARTTAHIYSWMLGSEIMRAAGIAPTPYYRLIANAEHALDQHPDPAQAEATTQGFSRPPGFISMADLPRTRPRGP